MSTLGAILSQLLHVALMVAAAPLVVGCIRWLKARMMGRVGASPLQPWRDLAKLLRKRPVLAENASWMASRCVDWWRERMRYSTQIATRPRRARYWAWA